MYDIQQSEEAVDINSRPFNSTCIVDGENRLLSPMTVENCTVKPINANTPTIWTFGDSHAGHLSGMLDMIYKKYGIGYHLVETPGKPFPQSSRIIFEDSKVIFDQAEIS